MSRPNFLFLMTDHQQAATIASDDVLTPNIDRLSARGVRFARNHTVNAVCSPARASIFTGVHVHTHGMYDVTHCQDDCRARFRTELPTWSQALADSGYHNAYLGKWHVERSNELRQFGWHYQMRETYLDWRREKGLSSKPRMDMQVKLKAGRGYAERPICALVDEPADATPTGWVFSRGAEYLQTLSQDTPWCMFVSTPDPHDPYVVPRRFWDMYDPAQIEKPTSFDDELIGKPNVLKRMQSVYDELRWEEFAKGIAGYRAQCTMIDHHVGRILDALEESGQAENTVVVLLTDHGDLAGAHRMFTKGITPYEEVYNTPLVWSGPGIAEGEICEYLTNTPSVCPTVLDMAGIDPFELGHFESLRPLLEKPQKAEWNDEAYAEFHGQRYNFTQRILWRGNLKYVMNCYDYDEMYDLANDPAELHNVAYDGRYAMEKDEMLRGIWRQIHDTGDETMARAQYNTLRFCDLGPDCVEHD